MLRSEVGRGLGARWWTALALGLLALVVAAAAVAAAVDVDARRRAWARATGDPVGVVVACAAFGLAFVLRALAWRRVLPGLPLGQALAGIHLAFGATTYCHFALVRRCGF